MKLQFDLQNNPKQPTVVLSKRGGEKLGVIPAAGFKGQIKFNDADELQFTVHKSDCPSELWDKITDFKLIWCKEWNRWFEIYVSVNEDGCGDNELSKEVTATALGEAELSQINLYDIEINSDEDIKWHDFKRTSIYNGEDHSLSLLHRITEKCPHYTINHVDESVAELIKVFSFDNKSIADAFSEIEKECECLIRTDCYTESKKIKREINVYDLNDYCPVCKERGNFDGACPECGNTDIVEGYGEDMGIFVSTANLADKITYKTDTGSVKNCFKLEGGDDMMTAAIRQYDPTGTGYIWYISDETKEEMSDSLRAAIDLNEEMYRQAVNDYVIDDSLGGGLYDSEYVDSVSNYNNLLSTYGREDWKVRIKSRFIESGQSGLPNPEYYNQTGYSNMMLGYNNTLDFETYLTSVMMPSAPASTAATQLQKIYDEIILKIYGESDNPNSSPVAVQNLSTATESMATNAILTYAKVLVDIGYDVSLKVFRYNHGGYYRWRGGITVKNLSDEEDTANYSDVVIQINGDYETFVKQLMEKALQKSKSKEITNAKALFDLSGAAFEAEIEKYGLNPLKTIRDMCQACIDVLTEQGLGVSDSAPDSMYQTLYLPYIDKRDTIDSLIQRTEFQITSIKRLKEYLIKRADEVQDSLSLEKSLGEALWAELCSFRREDTYKNDNYISDGLTNDQLFANAREFFESAQKEIYKSSMLQHSITATMKNLLAMREFEPLTDKFENGNWMRIKVNNDIYKLRLIEYGLHFSENGSAEPDIDVIFSDIVKTKTGSTDVQSILKQASSISSSYGSVSHQATQGGKSYEVINDLVDKGLDVTNTKIVSGAENQNIIWDENGFLCREYDPVTDTYSDKQLKIINHGIYITDDNWQTSKAALGKIVYIDPETQQPAEDYGVIADVLYGKLIAGSEMYITTPPPIGKEELIAAYGDPDSEYYEPDPIIRSMKQIRAAIHYLYIVQNLLSGLKVIYKNPDLGIDRHSVLSAEGLYVFDESDPNNIKDTYLGVDTFNYYPGDTFTLSNYTLAGFINLNKNRIFTGVPIPKSLEKVGDIRVESIKFAVRGVNGLVGFYALDNNNNVVTLVPNQSNGYELALSTQSTDAMYLLSRSATAGKMDAPWLSVTCEKSNEHLINIKIDGKYNSSGVSANADTTSNTTSNTPVTCYLHELVLSFGAVT